MAATPSRAGASNVIIVGLQGCRLDIAYLVTCRTAKTAVGQPYDSGLLSPGHAPNGVAQVVRNEKRAGTVDGEPYRPAARLALSR